MIIRENDEIVDNIEAVGEKTERGQGGFGSTGL